MIVKQTLLALGLAILAALIGATGAQAEPAAPAAPAAFATDGWARGVAVGEYHSCAITRNGGVKCWGDNDYSQAGDIPFHPPDDTRPWAVDVIGLSGAATALIAGPDSDYTCALLDDETVQCWGYRFGSFASAAPGLTGRVQAVAAGQEHTCVLVEDGHVKCWGDNYRGELGIGVFGGLRTTPVEVIGLADVVALSAGSHHTCAVTRSGGVKCWGGGQHGELGNGVFWNQAQPVDVSGLNSGVITVAGGGSHTCALLAGGAVKCWGANGSGQLGAGAADPALATPVDVVGLPAPAASLALGNRHTCAQLVDGRFWCWGGNALGQLGDGTRTNRATPTAVLGLDIPIAAVSAGNSHTCAVLMNGGVKCWGFNIKGQLGDGTKTDRLTPVDVLIPTYDCAQQTQIAAAECASLVTFFQKTGGMYWRQRDGWFETNTPCQWRGVTCDMSANGAAYVVTGLRLPENGLYGALPPALAALVHLRDLDLSHNNLWAFPPELGALRDLERLDLSENAAGVTESGIPAEWGNLTALRELNLSHAGLFDATLPPELGKLKRLERLDLTYNSFRNPLPPAWSGMAALRELRAVNVGLTGPLPAEWGALTALEQFDASTNELSGSLPPEWSGMTALQGITLTYNALTGALPPEWGRLTLLESIDLSQNQLAGPVPAAWGSLIRLRQLNLERNRFDGVLPLELANLAALEKLNLSYNALSGTIPPELAHLSSLTELDLSFNKLVGPIPPALGRLPALVNLYLNNNQLSGAIPPELGELPALRRATASTPIAQESAAAAPERVEPASLSSPAAPDYPGPPPYTGYLDLSCNQLSGPVPLSLGQLNELAGLMLTANQLSGMLPDEANYWGYYYTDLEENMISWPPGIPVHLYNSYNQTVPPTNVAAVWQDNDIVLTWTPVLFTLDYGYYEISYAANPDGPFVVHGSTGSKSDTAYTIDNILPDETYWLRVRTFTPAHYVGYGGPGPHRHEYYQQNDLWSDYAPLVRSDVESAPPARLWLPLMFQ